MLALEHIQTLGKRLSLYMPLSEEIRRYHTSQAPFRWLFGGNQSGKSFANMTDLALIMLDIHPFFNISVTKLHWACIESWEQARDILWGEHLQGLLPKGEIDDIQYGQNQVPHKVVMRNGHIVQFKAFNQGRTLFQGRAIDSAHCDEQCQYDFRGIFTELQARLLKAAGRCSWSMTPIIPQAVLEERIQKHRPIDECFYANLNDNRISREGYIPDERIDQMIEDWPIEMQETRIAGLFASFYGAVFKTFRRQVHVVSPFAIPEGWVKYGAIDFGFANPFVFLWAARNPDGDWYVYREYYRAKATIPEHVAAIGPILNRESLTAIYADPEDADGRQQLRNSGIITLTAIKDVARGIETVQSALKVKRNGKPSLYIFNTCPNACRELSSYRYPSKERAGDRGDEPLKENDHSVDALRYLLHSTEHPAAEGHVYIPE